VTKSERETKLRKNRKKKSNAIANEMKTKQRLRCWKMKSGDRKKKIERRNREIKYENEIGSKGEQSSLPVEVSCDSEERWRRMRKETVPQTFKRSSLLKNTTTRQIFSVEEHDHATDIS